MAQAGRGVYMRVRVKPQKREEFIGLIKGLVRDSKANESGTQVLEFMQAADPNEFVFFERFASEAAMKAHQEAPYHVAMSAAGWACLDGDPHIEQLTPVAP
jgi:quinol monooxygenase YgiN